MLVIHALVFTRKCAHVGPTYETNLRLTTGKNEKASAFLTCPCHEIYREEAAGLKKFQLYFKNYDFYEYVKFWAISWKCDILSITAWLK